MSERPSALISFVVPCYNYGRFLGECVGSMLNQKGDFNIEVVVVDDASTDNSVEVVKSFNDPRVRLFIHEKNQGHVITINEGIEYARGEFIARVDADDRLRPDFLQKTMAAMNRHADVGLIYGNPALIDAAGTLTDPGPPDGADAKENIYLRLLGGNFICAPTTLARREAWKLAMPIPKGLSHSDWLLSLRMARKFSCYHVNQVIADYRVHSANHHVKVIRDRSEEPSTFRILEMFFGEKEADAVLEAQKQEQRAGIMARHYVNFANNYFGLGMLGDARRCFLKAMALSPKAVLGNPRYSRLLLGSFLPGNTYEMLKKAAVKLRLIA